MLIPDEAYEALVESGIAVSAQMRGDRHVDLLVNIPAPGSVSHMLLLEVRRYTQPVTPQGVVTAATRWRDAPRPLDHATSLGDTPAPGLLLVTPTATAETLQKAADLGVSVIALDSRAGSGPRGHLALGPGDVIRLNRRKVHSSPRRRKSGLPAWGESQIVKALLLLEARTQTQIARWASVSQPRVSQVLKNLVREGLVQPLVTDDLSRTDPPRRTWSVIDWDGLLHYWIDQYPGPGGVTTYWYGVDSPMRQTDAALVVLRRRGNPGVLVSGDVAADLIAPWARPARATVYTEAGGDLSDAGLTPSAATDATLALIVPEDPSIWPVARHWWERVRSDQVPGGPPLADPLQVLYDVRNSPSVDAGPMAEALVRWIVELRRTVTANAETEPQPPVQRRPGNAGD